MSSQRPKVPTERPDRGEAERKPQQGKDRPGFDLGGKNEILPSGPTSGTTIPGGLREGPVPGRPKDGARR